MKDKYEKQEGRTTAIKSKKHQNSYNTKNHKIIDVSAVKK